MMLNNNNTKPTTIPQDWKKHKFQQGAIAYATNRQFVDTATT